MDITTEELKIICDTVVELTKIRQAGCNHLCVEEFAPECMGSLLTQLALYKEGKLLIPINEHA
tara:strand:- start:5326 stop:5514 length:189 start_codon:yes stop_codon:yes gene_type:complete